MTFLLQVNNTLTGFTKNLKNQRFGFKTYSLCVLFLNVLIPLRVHHTSLFF